MQVSRGVENKEISLLKEPSAVIPSCMRSVSDVHIFSTVSVTLIWETSLYNLLRGLFSLGSEKPALQRVRLISINFLMELVKKI